MFTVRSIPSMTALAVVALLADGRSDHGNPG